MTSPKRPTKVDLEIRKLQAEITAYEAEARKYNADAESTERWNVLKGSRSEHHRVYTLWDVVGTASASACVDQLGEWARVSDDPIRIIINSPGGGLVPGLALYDYIIGLRDSGIHITTEAIGWAASMGGILLQAGDRRVIGANAYMLIHEVSSGAFGKTSEMEEELAFIKRLQERCLLLLADRSTLSVAQIKRRWVKKDWWISAEQALEFGFVDAIR